MRDAVKLPMYYTVIGIRIEAYESTIEHERHFRDEVNALEYAERKQQQAGGRASYYVKAQEGAGISFLTEPPQAQEARP